MDDEKILFTIEKNEKVGRYAVASENLTAGQLIFSEKPLVYGPKSDSPVVCLGCYTPTDGTTLCSKCFWPVCGPECEILECHGKNECEIFDKSGYKFEQVEDPEEVCSQFECVTPLRMLLAIDRNKQQYNDIKLMETHNNIRKQKPIWEFNQKYIVDILREKCALSDKFSEELIHNVCGMLEINTFEAATPSGYSFRCLFPKFAVMSHSCVSNMHHCIDCTGSGNLDDCRVYVKATVDIPKGGELYCSYAYSLWPTLVRREFLRESKFFDCDCKRCSDPTELGTHLGSLKCQKCDEGVILSTNSLDDTCDWKCTHCEYKTNARAVRKIFAIIQNDIDQVEYTTGSRGIELREKLFKKYKSVLHPKNSYMTILRSALTQLYGKSDDYSLEELPDVILERKVELCNSLLEVLNIIEPGLSRIRGVTFYELHAPLMILARHEYQNEVISKQEFREKLQNSVELLGRAVEILKHEPVSQPEGQLGQMISMAYEQLQENLEMLVETA